MIFVERRRAGFTAELLWRVGAIWLAVSLISGQTSKLHKTLLPPGD